MTAVRKYNSSVDKLEEAYTMLGNMVYASVCDVMSCNALVV